MQKLAAMFIVGPLIKPLKTTLTFVAIIKIGSYIYKKDGRCAIIIEAV